DFALGREDAFGDGDAVATLHQWLVLPRNGKVKGEIVGALVTTDMQDVAEAPRRQHAGFRAIVLDGDVGGRGRAMDDHVDIGCVDAGDMADAPDTIDNTNRLIFQGRRNLVIEHAPGAFEYEVGIGSAYVHAYASHTISSFKKARPK